ncbi:MAG: arylesterase [Burkholderiaceae bacterium]|nr:arylesterase [Burkholderiaceae bacterium]
MAVSGWTRRRVLALLGVAAGPALTACGRKGPRARPVPKGAVVLALGDSLTFGTGATPDTAYPAELARLTGWEVVNAGVPGDTAAQARERLPALLDTAGAQLLILSIGGNDFLRRLPEADTRAHIEALCDTALARGLQVMLLAVPRPSLSAAIGSLTDHPMYADIAAARAVVLQREGWSEVLADADLRSDAIHANARGYAQQARNIVATARAAGLLPLS